ncbi:MAG: hypothetical protein ACRCWG_02290 [Sarcina sp.]
MLVQNGNMPIVRREVKFATLDEYLDFINRESGWRIEGFEWYCKFSPALFYINESVKEVYIEGPHIIELCNELVRAKSDKGEKIRFRTSEADWKFHLTLTSELNIESLKMKLGEWNKLIQDKIDSQRLDKMVLKEHHSRDKHNKLIKI